MEWMNIHVGTVDSEEYMTAEPPDQSTWLLLMRYCCGQENGGRIKNCRNWPERAWLTVCRVQREQAMHDCTLWKWEGDDLLINFYPEKQEWALQCQRRGGRKGQRVLQQRLSGIPKGNPTAHPATDPTRKGREGKEKEGKETNGGDGSFAVIPSDNEVSEFSAQWPGEMASGTPPMPREWVNEWLKIMNRRSGAWPLDWKRALIASWRSDHRDYAQRQNSGTAKNSGEKPLSDWALKQRREALEKQIATHPANEDSAAWLGEASEDETKNLETLRAELRELSGVAA